VAGGTLVFLSLVCALGWGWATSLSVPSRAAPLLAPTDAVGFAIAHVTGLHLVPVTHAVRAVGLLVVAAAAVLLVARSERVGLERGVGWTLLAFAALGPTSFPWYLTWGLLLVVATGLGALRRPVIAASVLLCVTYGPDGQGLLETLREPLKLACVLALVAALSWWAVRTGRRVLAEARATIDVAAAAPALDRD